MGELSREKLEAAIERVRVIANGDMVRLFQRGNVRVDLRDLRAVIDALDAARAEGPAGLRREGVRGALKPFAAVAEKIRKSAKDDECWCGQDGAVIRHGDLRRASAILALLDARQGGGDREGVGNGSLRRPSDASPLGSGGNQETREGMSSKGGERR